MKIALPIWNGRVAPVFDVTHRVVVVEADSGRALRCTEAPLPDGEPAQKVLALVQEGVHVLICGAISRPLQGLAVAKGLQVVPFVAGEVDEVLQAWLEGRLPDKPFAMPGCACGRPRRHQGKRRFGVRQ